MWDSRSFDKQSRPSASLPKRSRRVERGSKPLSAATARI
jgi:hypothetical protein